MQFVNEIEKSEGGYRKLIRCTFGNISREVDLANLQINLQD